MVYFLSDMHLGAPYMKDEHDAERRIVRFFESIREDAEAIYLLGDVLDYWYEYRYCVPRGFVRFFGELASLSDAGVKITWLIGNHDIWIFDYLPKELGVRVVDGPIVEEIGGCKFLLAHGDGLGNVPMSFRIIRSFFRNRFCQKMFSGIHPRWTIPLAHKWSQHSREHGESPMQNNHLLYDSLRTYSLEYLRKDPSIDYFIFGHLHIEKDEELTPGCRIVVLGEWLQQSSYAVFDGDSLQLKRAEL